MRALMFSVVMLFGAAAQADFDWLNTERIFAIKVAVGDNVSGGCWANPQATHKAVEQEFHHAGIELTDERGVLKPDICARHKTAAEKLECLIQSAERGERVGSYPHTFLIYATGRYIDYSCVVSLEMVLMRNETLKKWESQEAIVLYGNPSGLLITDTRVQMQSKITEEVTKAANSLADAIIRARK